jgi:transposase
MLLGLGLSRGGVMAWESGQSYSADLRSRVLAAVDGGVPARVAAQRFQVSVSYVYKALGRRKATGESEARPQRNHQELKLAAHHAAIAAEVAQRSDVTLNELRAWLLATHGVAASLGLMHRTLARLGLTLKKSPSGRRSRTGPISPNSAPSGEPDRVS